jgi:hypothetical protein
MDTHIIQSVLIPKDKYTLYDAIIYLYNNDYKIKKIDETIHLYRARQISPETLRKKGYTNYITVNKDNGIKLVIAYK